MMLVLLYQTPIHCTCELVVVIEQAGQATALLGQEWGGFEFLCVKGAVLTENVTGHFANSFVIS